MASLDLTARAATPRTYAVAPPRLAWSPGHAHWAAIVAFVGLHILLGVFSDYSPPPLASIHAVLALVAAVWLVGVRRDVEAVACIAAYLASCDVLWRMTGAAVPWEISKAALFATLALATVRIIRRPKRIGLPLLSLLLLTPSAVVTLERFGLGPNGRERLSFELGAHLALIAAVIFFSNLKVERQTLAGIFWVIIGPVVAVNAVATAGTIGLQSSDFDGGLSNAASSGGYGPNQVSALIGVGAMVSIFLVFLDRRPVLRVLAGGLAIWFLAQSALTFSRGGSFNLVVALVVATPFFLRTAQSAARFLAIAAAASLVIAFGMIPVIQHITGDQFGDRFTSSDPTLRGDLMRSELEAWSHNIGLGIGVGMMERTVDDEGAADRGELPVLPTHTEYTRLLAEHGLLGLADIVVLLALAIRAVRGQRLPDGRIIAVVLLAWCAAEVGHSATRLALVSFLFALASAEIIPDGSLQTGGDPARPGKGKDRVDRDRPPPAPRRGRAEDGAGDQATPRQGREGLRPLAGQAVQQAGGAPA
jgi:hypothetical protein